MASPVYNMHDAKTNLSKLVERAEDGEEIIIARNGKPAARLVKLERPKPKRVIGSLKGKIWVQPGYDIVDSDPEIVAMFEESAAQPIDPTER